MCRVYVREKAAIKSCRVRLTTTAAITTLVHNAHTLVENENENEQPPKATSTLQITLARGAVKVVTI